MDINSIIFFIKENNDFFYKKIGDFYFDNYFQDNRGEREIIVSINIFNCRYNACLIYTILNFVKNNNIVNINDLILDNNF